MLILLLCFGYSLYVKPNLPPNASISVINHQAWQQYKVCHKRFNWSAPLGLTKETLPLFWAQPENHRHFYDTNKTDHCGIVRIVNNGKVMLPFPVISNMTHFINTENPPRIDLYSQPSLSKSFLLILTGHWGHYFQHFFDNIGPQIALALEVLGFKPFNLPVVADISDLFPSVPKLWSRMGFTTEFHHPSVGNEFSANTLVMIESCPRIHPDFFKTIRQYLKLPKKVPEKIIWISRKMTNSYYAQRFILNENEIIHKLQKSYGKRYFVVYDHSNYTFEQTIELFASAKVIIGSHGGGMYNQFFAPAEAVIVEIMPVKKNGLYPDQRNFRDVPSFSHMAVWSNSLLIGQKFWRYYQITNFSNFYLNGNDFIKFLSQIPEMKIVDSFRLL
ncbi:hypothetical protein TRFO_07484 [Tritrichomonas foetus]|uniref:Glycosyltransferase 61 catalytic domain-containing protein n=1 Tax=Tritrichomonas foetus TaxID=1144522 RepID=A0A1J4JWC4_9EUKA|nr:hypothetical protein TRFO_07484 [Tritrichomonas foetus]|eukprot:OHT01589.1 hypothetical protein TRFO_07484 [Tritrichomonas foetus]